MDNLERLASPRCRWEADSIGNEFLHFVLYFQFRHVSFVFFLLLVLLPRLFRGKRRHSYKDDAQKTSSYSHESSKINNGLCKDDIRIEDVSDSK